MRMGVREMNAELRLWQGGKTEMLTQTETTKAGVRWSLLNKPELVNLLKNVL